MNYQEIPPHRSAALHEGPAEANLIGITQATIEQIMKEAQKYSADCIALYAFYAYTTKWQAERANKKYISAKATSSFCMQRLHMSRARFFRAKAILVKLNLIEDRVDLDESNKIKGWYVRVNHYYSVPKNHCLENPPSGNLDTNTAIYQLNTESNKGRVNKGGIRPYPTSQEEMYSILEELGEDHDIIYDGQFYEQMMKNDWRIKGQRVYDWVLAYRARLETTNYYRGKL